MFSFLVITNIYASNESIKTGLLYDRIFTTKKEAIIGSKLWLKQMEDSKYKNKMDISFYDDPKKMIKDFKDKKIEVMVCDAISYFEDKDLINSLSSKAWILSRIDSMFEQYYLVKNRKSKLTLKNLSPKNIYYKSDLSKIWLDTILHRDSIKLKNSSFIKLEKPKKMIFNIFFNEVDIAIIPKDLYDSMLD